MSATYLDTHVLPSEAEAMLAKKTKQLISHQLSSTASLDLRTTSIAKNTEIRIPALAAHLLVQILDEMSKGNAVKLVPVRPELTTQEAAELLEISRPTLIQLLSAGKIEFRKVGAHRRVRFESLMSYKRQLAAAREAALVELSDYDQEIGL